MILYIIRHADPDYEHNTITDFGRLEADALADYLDGITLDRIYVSPLGRAIETALPTCRHKSMPYTVLPWTAEGMEYMRKPDRLGDFRYTYSAAEGIEGLCDLTSASRDGATERTVACSDSFLSSLGYKREGGVYKVINANSDSVAVFCHGGFGSAWISHLMLRPAEMGFLTVKLGTTSITKFVFPGETGDTVAPELHWLGALPHIAKAGLRMNTR